MIWTFDIVSDFGFSASDLGPRIRFFNTILRCRITHWPIYAVTFLNPTGTLMLNRQSETMEPEQAGGVDVREHASPNGGRAES